MLLTVLADETSTAMRLLGVEKVEELGLRHVRFYHHILMRVYPSLTLFLRLTPDSWSNISTTAQQVLRAYMPPSELRSKPIPPILRMV